MTLEAGRTQVVPNKWQLRKLGDLAQILDHLRIPVNSEEREKRVGDVPYYGANGIQGYIDKPLFNEPLVLLAEDGGNFDDFLSRSIAYRIDGPSWVNNHAHILRSADSSVVLSFLFHALEHRDIRRYISGGTRGKLTQAELCSIEVLTPPTAEQARIAEVLDTLDEAICSVQMVLDKKNTALAGLLRSLFSPSEGRQGPMHGTPLGDYPSTWKVVPLRECVRPDTIITYGIVQAGPHVPEGVPYIRTGDMSGDALAAEGLLRTATRIDQAYARSKVRTGEIVCAIRATVGKVLPVPPELDGANLTQGTARIAPAQDINPSFLLWAIRSPRVQREIGLTVKGTTFAEITLEALREIPIPRPRDREEQNKIAATLDGLNAEIRAERVQLNKLQTIKSGLTADLLTGRIRCSDNGNI